MVVTGTGLVTVGWINLAQVKDQWLAVVKAGTIFQVVCKVQQILVSYATTSF